MAKEILKRLLMALVPEVKSLQLQRDHFARYSRELENTLEQNERNAGQLDAALRGSASQLHIAIEERQAADAAAAQANAALAALQRHNSSLVEQLGRQTYNFMGYDIPVDLVRLTGGGPETFSVISAAHISNLKRFVGINPDFNFVEIGCGIGRDAIPLTEILTSGSYVGIDIIRRSIEWCAQNISARHPNFQFVHFDVADQLHNSGGTTLTTEIRIPAPDASIDRIILFSVFTHMLRSDIEHYLREFRRVLKPSGLVYATTFIYTEEILAKARETNLTIFDLRFEHEIVPGCRINDPVHPLGAVAYTEEVWQQMLDASGMRHTVPPLHGAWSGFYSDPQDGQDVAILAPL